MTDQVVAVTVSDGVNTASASTVATISDFAVSIPIISQSGSFEWTFDVSPSTNNEDCVIGLSKGAPSSYADLAVIVRFSPAGTIDVRNGSAYSALISVQYAAKTLYHFRLDVNVALKTYSVFVTPAGQKEIQLANNALFRNEQATTSALDTVAVIGTDVGVGKSMRMGGGGVIQKLISGGGGGTTSGWTTIVETSPFGEGSGFVGAGTRKIYVSSSSGNDSNTGTLASPVATIAHGISLLRDGKPDWLLLKKGDTWTDDVPAQMKISGSSLTGVPGQTVSGVLLFGSYGTGSRPLVRVTGTFGNSSGGIISTGTAGGFAGKGSNFAIFGWEFYAHTRDPGSPSFVPGDAALGYPAIELLAHGTNLLIEDCKFSFFSPNLDLEPQFETGSSTWTNFYFRRNVVVDAYINAGGRSQGIFMDGLVGTVLWEENFFDHNGWNANVSGADQQNGNHNVYAAYNNNGPMAWNRNIFANDPGGAQFRSGGTLRDNLFIRNAINALIGNGADVRFNIVQESTDRTGVNAAPLKWGFQLGSGLPNPIFDHNLFVNSTGTGSGFGLEVKDATGVSTGTFTSGSNTITAVQDPGANGNGAWPTGMVLTGPHIPGPGPVTIVSASGFDGAGTPGTIVMSALATGNATEAFNAIPLNASVTNNYTFSQFGGMTLTATGLTQSGNFNDATGANNLGTPEPFDTTHITIPQYMSSLGLTATSAAFLAGARGQSKDSWNLIYTANAANNYSRVGFGMPLQ